MKDHYTIIVRGGGDLATGSIYYLWKSGFRVLVLEAEHPAAIRRQVSLSEAVYQKETIVEQMKAVRVESLEQIQEVWSAGNVPVLVDPNGESIQKLQPDVLIDAIIAKKNLGTNRAMAPLTIALGPGFFAGQDVDYVIETKRGHNLGRIITDGTAVPNTGIPGNIGGYAKERV
ncbi:MAG: EF2563 family selenium-dependent molybdenum hydroxylase system protein, partial [Roseburia sp.]|nr:EF2563 family selenium-dependent molybdenum hydroxylase system protein [Roseburia sp.]